MATSDYFDLSSKIDRGNIESTEIVKVPPDDSNILNLNSYRKIAFIFRPLAGKWYHLASPRSGMRIQGKFAVGKTGIRSVNETNPNFGTGDANSLKDGNITFDNAFFGRLFDSVQFSFGQKKFEDIGQFPEYFQLMTHLQNLPLRICMGQWPLFTQIKVQKPMQILI